MISTYESTRSKREARGPEANTSHTRRGGGGGFEWERHVRETRAHQGWKRGEAQTANKRQTENTTHKHTLHWAMGCKFATITEQEISEFAQEHGERGCVKSVERQPQRTVDQASFFSMLLWAAG